MGASEGIDPHKAAPTMESWSAGGTRARLLDAAQNLLAEGGVKALSVRTLAAATDLSSSAVPYHLGDKDEMLAAAFRDAMAADAREIGIFLSALGDAPMTTQQLLECITAYCLDLSGDKARIERIWYELIHHASHNAETRPLLAEWTDVRLDFWRTLFGLAGQSRAAADALFHYLSGDRIVLLTTVCDAAIGLSLIENIKHLCFAGIYETEPPRWYPHLRARLTNPYLGDSTEARQPNEVEQAILKAAIALIVSQGVASVTHRAVAENAQVSLSSTTYHFKSRTDIIRRAFAALYYQLTATIPDRTPLPSGSVGDAIRMIALGLMGLSGAGYPAYPVTRAPSNFALEASREPSLAPLYARLRQVRGLGVMPAFNWALSGIATLTPFEAHVFACWVHGRVQMLDSLAEPDAPALLAEDIATVLAMILPARAAAIAQGHNAGKA